MADPNSLRLGIAKSGSLDASLIDYQKRIKALEDALRFAVILARLPDAASEIPMYDGKQWLPKQETAGGVQMPFIYSISGALSVVLGDLRLYALTAGSIALVHVAVGQPSSGSDIIVQVNLNNVGIGTADIVAGTNTAQFTPVSNVFSAGDFFTIDVNSVGSVAPGSDLVVQIKMN
jgi:hypothetical protein